jgi:hypothetical protein
MLKKMDWRRREKVMKIFRKRNLKTRTDLPCKIIFVSGTEESSIFDSFRKAYQDLRIPLNFHPVGYNLLPLKFTMPGALI